MLLSNIKFNFLIFTSTFIIFLFFSAVSVFAINVEITNIPSTISDQPFEFNVLITGAQKGINYLRTSIFQPSTTNYFGYTFNGTDYYNGSDYLQYLPITINNEGSGSATIKAKIDLESSYFKGTGDYLLKIRRYTSASYNTSSNEVTISINYALPTDTPIPTKTPTPTPTDKPSPTPTPTPTATPVISKSKTATVSSNTTYTAEKTEDVKIPENLLASNQEVAGESIEVSPTPIEGEQNADNNLIIKIIAGLIIISALGGVAYWKKDSLPLPHF